MSPTTKAVLTARDTAAVWCSICSTGTFCLQRIWKVALNLEIPVPFPRLSFQEVMSRAEMFSHHQIQFEPLSVRERMTNVLESVNRDKFISFIDLFTPEEGRRGVVVTLLAILELIKESLIEMVQNEAYGPIYVKARHESTTA